MGRRTSAPHLPVLTTAGVAVDDTAAAESAAHFGGSTRGVKTLAANTTYYVPLTGAEDSWLVALMSQWDAAIIITSITVEETDAPPELVSNHAASAGNWFTTPTARMDSAFNGAGTTTNTNNVIAHTAAGAGGAVQNVRDTAARRHRAAVVVGATGGEVRFCGHAKE